jgi:hypothetical protein
MSVRDNDEDLSDECREDIRAVLVFHDSEDRKRYSAERLDNDLDDIRKAAEGGMCILKEHGHEFLRDLTDSAISGKNE